jgi:hypothetical protein
MLITCHACNSKIRVPEKAYGKRIKCPKCTMILQVPAAEPASETPVSESISNEPLPSPPPPPPPPLPTQADEDQGASDEETDDSVTASPSSAGKLPPPIKANSRRGGSVDDDDDDEEERPKKKSGRKRGNDDDEEDDDDRRPKKRGRRDDDDDDDDDLDVRRRRGRRRDYADQPSAVNGLAMTSMILGIISAVSLLGSCCCGLFSAVSLLCGIMAIIFGFMGKSPGSEAYAWTGIISGGVAVLLSLAALIFFILVVGAQGMMEFNQMNQRKRF